MKEKVVKINGKILLILALAIIFGVLGFFAITGNVIAGDSEDIILKLSSSSNSHGEVWNGTDYNTLIKYSDIFGGVYSGDNPNICTGSNTILKLSSETNAHAQEPNYFVPITHGNESGLYSTDVCYDELQCSLIEGDCANSTTCVVKLSNTTNAHLETCANSNYNYSVCCIAGAGANCESLTTKDDCWNLGDSCTWTPPGTVSNPDGGCCGEGEKWDDFEQVCVPTKNICNNIWAVDNQVSGTTYKLSGSTFQYCAQVTSGLSYGFWYDVNKF